MTKKSCSLIRHATTKSWRKKVAELSDMLSLKGDKEEVKVEKQLKILASNKLLNRLSVSLSQIKAGKNNTN